ncbi:TM2 domain-containing membrane protein YozV [Pseudarthrobacter defluvii]|uniref:TM2 domain-containing protein n=1 Tax=Pseudarthrobacter defluvii TaxID=410837 RepID=UPI002784B8E4|nr:TM2 domain-containing protein [Pseudarthrobacter defluvii]MDQ0770162.1 TM2 domain-containing membrane protein YozV [Pseudarthrobacter defluvii]
MTDQQPQQPENVTPPAPHPGQPQPPQYQAPQPGQPQPPQYQTPYPGQGQYQASYPQMSQQPPAPNQGQNYPQQKSKLVAGLLGIFLGGLGIHRFYLGYTLIGIIQIVVTIVLSSLGLGFLALWGLVEGIMILAGAASFRHDAKNLPLRD